MGAGGGVSRRVGVVVALLVLYALWGSTYLAIRVTLEAFPPLLMAGMRFVVGGGILYAWARLNGAPPPPWRQWALATGVGALFFVGGNGGVVWAETRVPSGVAALLIAMVPMWIAILEAVFLGLRPTVGRGIGLVIGLGGVALLVGPGADDAGRVDPLGALALTGSALAWASGTLVSRRAALPKNAIAASGMEMFGGGVLLLLIGVGAGELRVLDPGLITARAVLAWGWLLVAGSIVGFTLYQWLLRVSTPAVASTYAYVNPAVAVLLGAWVAHEVVGQRIGIAGVLITIAVVLITTFRPVAVPGSMADANGST
jgi:drug/metabolite transporter (DMT)-like permease